MGARRRRSDRAFQRRLHLYWGEALDRFAAIVELSYEMGSAFNNSERPGAHAGNDVLFEAIVRIHGRACRAAREIHVLLSSGYSTAAEANWRTLHELQICAAVLAEGGQPIAERFLDHELIDRCKLAERYEEHHEALNQEPLEVGLLTQLRSDRAALIQKYGSPFKEDWGWAAPMSFESRPPGSSPTLLDLEKKADLNSLHPYLQLSNQHLHGGTRTVAAALVSFRGQPTLFTGATNDGLAEVAQNALNALGRITSALLLHTRRTSLGADRFLDAVGLQILIDEAVDAFGEAHERVQAAELRATAVRSVWSDRVRMAGFNAQAAQAAIERRLSEFLPHRSLKKERELAKRATEAGRRLGD